MILPIHFHLKDDSICFISFYPGFVAPERKIPKGRGTTRKAILCFLLVVWLLAFVGYRATDPERRASLTSVTQASTPGTLRWNIPF